MGVHLVVVIIYLFLSPKLAFPFNYDIIDLGTLGGYSLAVGINDNGNVVGNSQDSSGQPQAFLWTKQDGMKAIGNLGGVWSFAYDMNSSNQIVGRSLTTATGDHAFFWSQSQGMIDLGTLKGGTGSSVSLAINNDGIVVGSSDTTTGAKHASLWTSETGMTDLHMLGNLGGDRSVAQGINSQGQIVGFSTTATASEGPRAVLWTVGGGITDLTGDYTFGYAMNINDRGDVLVSGAKLVDGVLVEGSSLRTAQGEFIDLGTLGGTGFTIPFDINNRGQVVGMWAPHLGLYHPFLWDAKDGMVDLNNLLPPNSPWLLENYSGETIAINNRGQIVGVGRIDLNGDGVYDADHAFLMTPVPEPTTMLLLGLGLMGIAGMRRKFKS